MLRAFSLLFLLSILVSQYSAAQNGFTSSKKAFRFYNEAEGNIDMKNYAEAEKSLKKAIKADRSFAEAYNMLGDVYVYENKPEEAIASYKKGLQLAPNRYPVIYVAIGNVEFSLEEYRKAKEMYMHYLQYNDIYKDVAVKVKRQIDDCDFAIEAMKHPVTFRPKNLGPGVNSKFDEYFPCLTVDGKTLLYTRLVEVDSSKGNEKYEEDFFVSHLHDSTWSESKGIGPPINTPYNEGAPCLSADGQVLIFTACEEFGSYGDDRTGYGSCDLFFSRKNGNSWTNPVNLGPPINTSHWESQPSYSSDGRTIYFVRGFTDKQGHKYQYIFMSELGADGKWGKPVKLNDNINSGDKQETVFIHPDNQTLYFSSDGPPGMGGMDIFMSKREKDGDWGPPVNLGYPINTVKDETSFTVSGDGKTAYFASDRPGGYGGLDLYSYNLPVQDRPLPVSYIKGKIYDKDTKEPVYAQFELIDLSTGKVAVKSYSNKESGEFLVCLPLNKDYAFNVSANKYLFYSENFSFKNSSFSKSELPNPNEKIPTYTKDIALEPIKVGATVVMKNIFFETAKYDLKPESKIELDKLIDLLSSNPKMKIQISGYTDNVGGTEYNQTLSENRAKAVYDYLIAHNISADRLTYRGYGETHPIDTNNTPEGRANNRRTEFKVIGN